MGPDCPTKTHVCSKCAGPHSSNDCISHVEKCINCDRLGVNTTDHYAHGSLCPTYRAEIQKLQKEDLRVDLNLQPRRPTNPT